MTQYSITVVNQSDTSRTYTVFQAPPGGAATPDGWSVSQTIAPGASAKVAYSAAAPKSPGLLARLCALLFRRPPGPTPGQFRLTADPDGAKPQTHIDFAADPSAPTKIVHGADNALRLAATIGLGYASFLTPVGPVAPTVQGDNFLAPFTIVATFTNSAGGDCANGEYRQYVMGTFKVDGMTLTHLLCGSTAMQPAFYQEDGCPPTACSAFGYRACPPSEWSRYLPDQATGPQFRGYDQPGFFNMQPDFTYSIQLQIEGQLIDVSDGTMLTSNTWSVEGQILGPPRVAQTAQGFQATDRLVAVKLAHNLSNNAPEVHVVIARPWGSPRLDPNAVRITLVDAEDKAVTAAEPVAHEVGNQRGTTASIVHRLTPGQATPVKATLEIDGQVTEMAIETA